jgi:hypothetical protein
MISSENRSTFCASAALRIWIIPTGALDGYAGLNVGEYPNSDADMTYHVLNNSLIQLISETIGGDLVRPRLPPEDGSLFAH